MSIAVLVPNRGVETIHTGPSTTVRQLVDILASDESIRGSIVENLGEECASWALQVVKEEREGRAWEEEELADVGDGKLYILIRDDFSD
jgi:hypothetical protein